jgi:2-polyprenyl-3-methyl-5-hydroxy-6-metoxy-1,4-benzoquinol methylase
MADNEAYWVQRHAELEGSLASVGKVGTPESENRQRYGRKKRRIADFLRSLECLDLNGKSVLDAGCGVGAISEIFFALGGTVYGVDASPIATNEARDRAGPPPNAPGNFKVGSLIDFDFENQFAFVFCLDVLYHVVDDHNWHLALKNLSRHTAPGGHLIIIDHLSDRAETHGSHVRSRTLAMYDAEFADRSKWKRIHNERIEFLIFHKIG